MLNLLHTVSHFCLFSIIYNCRHVKTLSTQSVIMFFIHLNTEFCVPTFSSVLFVTINIALNRDCVWLTGFLFYKLITLINPYPANMEKMASS